MAKQALIVWGGWDGHTPKQSADVFAPELQAAGYEVDVRDSLAVYEDHDHLKSLDLIVPIWTMGEITKEQWQGLNHAVRAGVGCAGFHGGIIDSFRNNTDYQWMTGGQWVAHPGNCIPSYTVDIADKDHEITRDLPAFELTDTEQYYCHIDPAVHVLCTTTFSGDHGDNTLYQPGTVMPYAWTKTWGAGRVFVAAWGHTDKDFDVPEAKEIVRRGMLWASR
ncbi:ThuA domain-containing protein [Phycisphaerales bacterium AB-hyl4]|uniref:ThuA domain-containing protein n=1 Tax=Natronomicrosphaera hydrolytica TaxID=3242702 RepID=A0ABV4U316_9BACT